MEAIVDIETTRIENNTIESINTIHCIVAKHYKTGEVREWVGDQCQEFGEWSKRISKFIMHNGISFDAPLLNKITGSNISPSS